jgi:4-carboxymuconolactone decarboxylase
MDERERYAAGLEMRRAVLGDAHVNRAIAGTTDLTADFQDLITRYAWGEIWTRPGLDVRARRLIVLGTLIALGRWDEFGMHARAAFVEGGISAAELKEIALQQAIYCGVPAGNKAFEMIREVIDGAG